MKPFARQKSHARSLTYGVRRVLTPGGHLMIALEDQSLKFELPTISLFARLLYKYRAYEPSISNWLISQASNFQGKGICIDIGANFGWYSCLLSKLLPNKEILAFEPEPDNFELLKRQIALNGASAVTPFQLGLGETESLLRLHKYKKSNTGRHSLLPMEGAGSVDVQVKSLDAHLRSIEFDTREIDLLKIDIEGFELFALKGASQALSRVRHMVLEYSPDLMQTAGINSVELLDLLEAHGFKCAVFSNAEGGRPEQITFQALRKSNGQVDLWLTR